jgi:hypothetical protein
MVRMGSPVRFRRGGSTNPMTSANADNLHVRAGWWSNEMVSLVPES